MQWRSGDDDKLAPALISDAHHPDASTLDIGEVNSVDAIDRGRG